VDKNPHNLSLCKKKSQEGSRGNFVFALEAAFFAIF
jgi:hypothetical protein